MSTASRSGSQSARQMSPSARARAHEKKIKEREQKRIDASTPAPGTYQPKRPQDSRGDAEKLAGSHAFKSRTPRGKADHSLRDLTLNLDPGAAPIIEAPLISARAKRKRACERPALPRTPRLHSPIFYFYSLLARADSFSKSQLGGHGSFGALSKRSMRLDIMGEGLSPCPTQYADAKADLVANSNKMPSASFKSASDQRPKYGDQFIPPPGTYFPDNDSTFNTDGSTKPHTMNAGAFMSSKHTRFKSDSFTHSGEARGTGPDLAPGSHDLGGAASYLSIADEVNRSVKRMSSAMVGRRSTAGFGARLPSRDLPFEKKVIKAKEAPGPGAYDTAKTTMIVDGHVGSFKSGTQRMGTLMPGFVPPTTDPGMYEPTTNTDMAATTKHTFSKSQSSGYGNFGTHAKRNMRLDILGEGWSPCPTAYGDAKADLVANSNKMPSASFKSASDQRPTYFDKFIPPPGAYSPDNDSTFNTDGSTKPHTMNAGAFLYSKSQRFTPSMLFDKQSSNTPDAYEPRMLNSGGSSTIAGSVKAKSKSGRSAGFRSESVRDLNGAFFAHEPFF